MKVDILSKALDDIEFDKLTQDPCLVNIYKQRNNIVSGFLIQGNDIKKFVPSHESTCTLDLDFLPPNASIVATSEQGIVVFEISKVRNHWKNAYYVCKPATKQVLALPNPKYKLMTAMVAILVLASNPLHYKIVRWSRHEPKPFSCFNYVVTRKLSYSRHISYHCEIFDSMTWEWRRTYYTLTLPLSFTVNCWKLIVTSNSIYMLLTNNKVLKFDSYSERSTMFSLPVPTLKYGSLQLINYEGKLGFACKSPNGYWMIWVLTANELWEKLYEFEEKRETPDGLFGLGVGITNYCSNDSNTLVLLSERLNYKTFTFKSDFETVDLVSRKKLTIANKIRHIFFKTGLK